jgi:AcrR family transcriptional regulator
MRDASTATNTREAILDATDRLLSQFGYRKMTIDDLAREVGIGKGSIYLHFTSKEEVALSHIDRIISRLKDKLQAIADQPRSVDERLQEMLLQRVLYRFDSVQHYSKGMDEMLAHIRASLLERRKRYFEEEAGILAKVIAEGQSSDVLVPGDPEDIARSLIFATNALLPYSLSVNELGDRAVISDRTRKTAEILIRGLKK